jgi:hypothetical protein
VPAADEPAAVHQMIIDAIETSSDFARRTYVPGGNHYDLGPHHAGGGQGDEQGCELD